MGVLDKHIKDSTLIIVLAMSIMSAGVVFGSICLMQMGAEDVTSLGEYLKNFLNASQSKINAYDVFKNAFRENLIYFAVVFFAGFFRIGLIFIAAALVRKGFIIGFTSAAFIKFYGAKGLLVTISMLPGIVLLIPAFLFLSAVSAKLSVRRIKTEKNFLIYYIFFAAVIVSIFCVSALSEGYLTTTFMKLISPTIIK